MDTSRIDGVKAPQHRGTPRSHLFRLEFCRIVFSDNLDRPAILALRAAGADDDFQRFAGDDVQQSLDESSTTSSPSLLALQVTRRAPTAPQLHLELPEAHHDLVLVGSRDAMQGDATS
jgi:hypothetical protein